MPDEWITIREAAMLAGIPKSICAHLLKKLGAESCVKNVYENKIERKRIKHYKKSAVLEVAEYLEERGQTPLDVIPPGWRTVKSLAPECGIQPHAVREWIKKLGLRSRIEHFPTGWKAMLIPVESAEYLKKFLEDRRLPVPEDMISEAEAVKVIGCCRSSFYRLKKRNPWLFCIVSAFPDGRRRRWFHKQDILSLKRRDRELAAEIEKKRREIEHLQRQRFFNPLTH